MHVEEVSHSVSACGGGVTQCKCMWGRCHSVSACGGGVTQCKCMWGRCHTVLVHVGEVSHSVSACGGGVFHTGKEPPNNRSLILSEGSHSLCLT